ncbi:MAG: hypothetical protein ABJH05_09480 [Fulvivirga sp.]
MQDEPEDFKIIECLCSWYDLLGFGQPLMDSNWDLNNEQCESQLKRIKSLDLSYINTYSSAHGTTSFSLNDGIILNYDIDDNILNIKEQIVKVLDDLVLEYESLNVRDVRNGFPGVRGIITFGHRYNYTHVESTYSVSNNKTLAYHPQVFQMNTAFSKAYIMESSGSKSGIAGNHLYIDKFLINSMEKILTKKKDDSPEYTIKREINSDSSTIHFTFYRDYTALLSLEFDKSPVEYNFKGIETKLYKYINRQSRQDQLAQEAEFRRAQRYLQMEKEEFGEEK